MKVIACNYWTEYEVKIALTEMRLKYLIPVYSSGKSRKLLRLSHSFIEVAHEHTILIVMPLPNIPHLINYQGEIVNEPKKVQPVKKANRSVEWVVGRPLLLFPLFTTSPAPPPPHNPHKSWLIISCSWYPHSAIT